MKREEISATKRTAIDNHMHMWVLAVMAVKCRDIVVPFHEALVIAIAKTKYIFRPIAPRSFSRTKIRSAWKTNNEMDRQIRRQFSGGLIGWQSSRTFIYPACEGPYVIWVDGVGRSWGELVALRPRQDDCFTVRVTLT